MEISSSPYIDLLKKMLCDFHRANRTEFKPLYSGPHKGTGILKLLDKLLRSKNFAVSKINDNSVEKRMNGLDRPAYADTMIGMKRLNNIEFCVKDVIQNNVPGDLIELGVWRGGATILMRALLKEMKITDRNVWVADSFEGLPKPNQEKYPQDKNDQHFLYEELAVPLEEVKRNFEKYNLLDAQVKFLEGWFKDTLPSAPIKELAILRLDGDMYGSTMDSLVYLYPKLSVGGYLIADDWGAVPACRQAIKDYRKQHSISEEIKQIDWTGIYWKKEKQPASK